MTYLLDSNTLIEAKNLYYRFSFCPGYWNWVIKENAKGNIYSAKKIKAELLVGNDDLAGWAKKEAKNLFLSETSSLAGSLAVIAQWVSDQKKFKPAALTTFLRSADYYLIAEAHARGYAVVTREKSEPDSKKRVMIPDVCKAVGVTCISPFDLLEQGGAVFQC